MTRDTRNPDDAAAWWLAAALVALPFLQALPIDFDRTGPLFLLPPALWAGRRRLVEATVRLFSGPPWLRVGAAWLGGWTLLATVAADHPAPAAVTAASWVLLGAAGLLAGRLIGVAPRASERLLAGLALGAAAGIVAVWAWWWAAGRGDVPLYAHHRHLGMHALAGAVACTALLVRPAGGWRARLGWAGAGMVIWGGLLWSGGRGPVLALALGLAAWWWQTPAAPAQRLLAWSAVQLLAGLGLSAAMWTPLPQLGWWHAFSRTTTALQSADVSTLTSTRTEFWSAALQQTRAAPWLGHGPDAYRFLTPKLDGQQPHNLWLQLWLDLGLGGALPALVLLAGALVVAWRRTRKQETTTAPDDRPWLALGGASLALGMLDGAFYHLVLFLPAMLALGRALDRGGGDPPREAPSAVRGGLLAATGAAVGVLLLHAWLFYALAVAPPPAGPEGCAPRSLKIFPSTTFGLGRWLDAWEPRHPEAALAWAVWAQTRAPNAPLFHVYAARYRLARGDRAGAEAELRAALAKAHWTVRPGIETMLREIAVPR